MIRFEYNNGRIHDDKSISQYNALTLAINVKYIATNLTENTLAC